MLSRNQVKDVEDSPDSYGQLNVHSRSCWVRLTFICCLVLKRNYANINWSSGSQCWSSDSFQSEFNKTQWLSMLFLFSSESSAGLANFLHDDVEWTEKIIRWIFLGVICQMLHFQLQIWSSFEKKNNIQAFQTVTLDLFSREDEGGSDSDPSVEANSRQKNASVETAQMLKLRQSLHQLTSFRMQKENEVLRARSGP